MTSNQQKKFSVGARSNVNDIFRKERAEVFMDNDPRAGYENDLENRVVYRRIESHIEELRIDEAWTKKRFRLGFLISLSFIAGVFLFVFSNMRVRLQVFESQPEVWWFEVMGYILMAPSLFGCAYFCCPTKKQKELRREIMARRRIRLKLYPEDFKEIEKFVDKNDEFARRQQQLMNKATDSKGNARANAYRV